MLLLLILNLRVAGDKEKFKGRDFCFFFVFWGGWRGHVAWSIDSTVRSAGGAARISGGGHYGDLLYMYT